MADLELPTTVALLEEADLLDKAEKVSDEMYRLRWGSAMVIVGTAGAAIVVIAPLFKTLPKDEATFTKKLLQLNATMGGMASFAIQADGWIVLHAGRGRKGLDAEEFGIMVGTVGKFADDFDDILHDEFYATPEERAARAEEAAKAADAAGPGNGAPAD